VRDYLVSNGVPADKISSVGLGQGRPVADNSTAEGRANNRRVEIIVQPIEKR
jgi:outer membrane protein OmpA-like peptidoglycan-associated protein